MLFYSPPVSNLSCNILRLSNKLTVYSLTSVSDPVSVTEDRTRQNRQNERSRPLSRACGFLKEGIA